MAKYGVAVHGAGWVSGEHIKAYMKNPHCEVVAISSRREESARQKACEAGLDCRIYTDFDQVCADPEVQIVSICTPNHLHAQETIKAARAGKHILIEKPVALNLPDLRAMHKAVREAKVKTVVSFVLHWNPLFQCIKALLAEDALGQVFYGEVDYWHGIGRWYGGYDWVTKKETGGSMLLAAGCHAVDAIRYFVGSEIVEVMGYATKVNPDYEYDATIVAAVKFANGAVGKVSGSLECVMPYNFNIDLMGTHGSIRNDRLYSRKLLPGQTGFATIPTILPDSGDVTHHPFEGEINHFVECILQDVESHVNLEDAVKTHEVCFAIDRSAAEGRPIQLPLP